MAISPPKTTLLLLLLSALLLLTTTHSTTTTTSDLLSELTTLQSDSPTGVIHLTDNLFKRILSIPTPRPFHFIIFFDARQLHSKPELSLPKLKSEFSLISKSYITNNPPSSSPSNLFFFDIEFSESQSTFARFGVNSLPHIKLLPPFAKDVTKDAIQMDASDFSRLADSMADFIESKTKITVGPIHRPPIVSRNQIIFLVSIVLILSPLLIKKLLTGNTIFHDKLIWLAGAIFVYFFSVSGAMFNIIRKMPMFLLDRNDPNKLVFFYQGSGMQLGAEGFAVGFLYTVVGLLLAFSTHVLVKVKNRTAQRFVMLISLFIAFWAVCKVVSLDNWKTGYSVHAYWPTSWR